MSVSSIRITSFDVILTGIMLKLDDTTLKSLFSNFNPISYVEDTLMYKIKSGGF